MMLAWLTGWPRVAIAPDHGAYVMYQVDLDGTLNIRGDNWKEYRRRKRNFSGTFSTPREPLPGVPFDSPEDAMAIAELIQQVIEAPEGFRHERFEVKE